MSRDTGVGHKLKGYVRQEPRAETGARLASGFMLVIGCVVFALNAFAGGENPFRLLNLLLGSYLVLEGVRGLLPQDQAGLAGVLRIGSSVAAVLAMIAAVWGLVLFASN